MPGGARAQVTSIYLGASSQDYVLHGEGAYAPGLGSFTNQQGGESYDPGTNTTTDTLSGVISGSSDPALASGSYAFVTTYAGTGIGAGGAQIQSVASPINPDKIFFYSDVDLSVDMTLYLTGTPSGNYTVPMVTNGVFSSHAAFAFASVTAACTGVIVCTQNNVGLTPGATQYGPVTIQIGATSGVPEPGAWAMLLVGFGSMGMTMRSHRKAAAA
jgi:hypothetical protein